MEDLAGEIADAIAGKGGHLNKSSDILVMIAYERAELFHNQYGEAFARARVNLSDSAAVRILRVRSRLFRIWLGNQHWQRYGKVASSESLNSALNVCEAQAVYDGPLHELYNRVATYQGAIYYDLGDSRIVKVTEDAWDVLDCETVPPLFQSYPHQRPQVEPARDGDLRLLLKYLNLQYEDDGSLSDEQVLTLVTLPTILIENISHPIIVLAGPQGSAKTTFMKLLRLLLDPSAAPLLTLGDTPRELAQQLQHNCVPCYDNLPGLRGWVSDMLCRACTGGGFAKRGLYTDDEDVFFDLHRCVILNGINIIPTKPDLLDRSLIITLLAIKPSDRVEEAELLSGFEVDRPRILGGLFDTLSKAIKLKPSVKVSEKPRMADYATFGCAVAEAIDIGAERFLQAYRNNIRRQIEEALHSSLVAEALFKLTDNLKEGQPEWKGTATQLLFELETIAEELLINKRARGWPRAPHALTRRLNQDKTTLQAFGIEMSIVREGKKGIRLISIKKASAASASLVSNDASDSHSSLKQHRPKSPSAPTDAISSTDGIIPASNTRVDTQTQTPPIDDVRMLVLRAARMLTRERNEACIDDLQRVLAGKASVQEIYVWMERLGREGLVEVIDHGRWRAATT